jgi:hypothetical protein
MIPRMRAKHRSLSGADRPGNTTWVRERIFAASLLTAFALTPWMGCSDATNPGPTGGTGASGTSSGDGSGDCTADEAPPVSCNNDGGAQPPDCSLESDGGCPTLTITWSCLEGEGGFGWRKSVDTDCDCAAAADVAACEAIGGCAWVVPDEDDSCASDGQPISTAGCYERGCYLQAYGETVDGSGCYLDVCLP